MERELSRQTDMSRQQEKQLMQLQLSNQEQVVFTPQCYFVFCFQFMLYLGWCISIFYKLFICKKLFQLCFIELYFNFCSLVAFKLSCDNHKIDGYAFASLLTALIIDVLIV